MSEALKRHVGNDWLPTEATITACEQTLLGQESFTDEGYTPPEYRISFSYVVNGRTLEDSYLASYPQECGHRFEILYDPEKPSRNTGSDTLVNPWLKWGAGIILGIGLPLLAGWLAVELSRAWMAAATIR